MIGIIKLKLSAIPQNQFSQVFGVQVYKTYDYNIQACIYIINGTQWLLNQAAARIEAKQNEVKQ